MTEVETARRARVIIALTLSVPMRSLTDDADFRRDLGADSLDLVELPAALEDEFGIRLSDGECAFCQTVGTAIDVIRSKLENRTCATDPTVADMGEFRRRNRRFA